MHQRYPVHNACHYYCQGKCDQRSGRYADAFPKVDKCFYEIDGECRNETMSELQVCPFFSADGRCDASRDTDHKCIGFPTFDDGPYSWYACRNYNSGAKTRKCPYTYVDDGGDQRCRYLGNDNHFHLCKEEYAFDFKYDQCPLYPDNRNKSNSSSSGYYGFSGSTTTTKSRKTKWQKFRKATKQHAFAISLTLALLLFIIEIFTMAGSWDLLIVPFTFSALVYALLRIDESE